MIHPRYTRNIPALTKEECALLAEKKVCVIGCGGLGGSILEYLSRIGVGMITAVDGDVFDETNLNRQLLSSEQVIGKSKAQTAVKRIRQVNHLIRAFAVEAFLTEENAESIIGGHDLVIDALDSPGARVILAAACRRLGITMIHGAISGWCGQVAVVPPESRLIDVLYAGAPAAGDSPSTLAFTPSLCASIEVAEAVKYLCGRKTDLIENMLFFDLQSNSFNLFNTKEIAGL